MPCSQPGMPPREKKTPLSTIIGRPMALAMGAADSTLPVEPLMAKPRARNTAAPSTATRDPAHVAVDVDAEDEQRDQHQDQGLGGGEDEPGAHLGGEEVAGAQRGGLEAAQDAALAQVDEGVEHGEQPRLHHAEG